MTKVRIAINGMGRIGRCAFKIISQRGDCEVVAVNDLTDTKTIAHLLKYDTTYHSYNWYQSVEGTEGKLLFDGREIKAFAEAEPAKIVWKDLDVDVVLECSGFFTKGELAKAHLDAGAKKVIISAPSNENAKTIVLGVNEDSLTKDDKVISCASCTTNCVGPILKVLDDAIGVESSLMSTIHSYTNSQKLQDGPAKDLREARAGAVNIVPTTTGASKAVVAILPQLDQKFEALSIRVPSAIVSLVDLVVICKKETTIDKVNEIFKNAAKNPYWRGILTVNENELVSSDFIGNSYSSIVDLPLNKVNGKLIKIIAWYDNEWGYSNRLVELAVDAAKLK